MNLYEIGVRMTMTHNMSPILTTLAHQFMHLHGHINRATAAAERFRMAVGGAVTALAGLKLGQGLGHVIDEGAKLVNVQQQMMLQGWKRHELDQALMKARAVSADQRSLSVQELLEMQKEVAPALGDRHHATEILPTVAKLATALRAVYGDHANVPSMIQEAVKVAELAGAANNDKDLERNLDFQARMYKAFGGTVSPHDMNMFMRGLKTLGPLLSDDFLGTIAPTLVQEGGQGMGNALFQAYQQIAGGRMMKQSADALDELGLINRNIFDPRKKKNFTPEGRLIKRAPPGSVIGADLFAHDPSAWVGEHFIPALVAKGKMTNEQVEAIAKGQLKSGAGHDGLVVLGQQLSAVIGRQTAQMVIDIMAGQKFKVDRDSKLIREAMGLNEGANALNNDNYQTNLAAFHAQWENLIKAFGSGGVPAATEVLKDLSIGLNSLAEVAFKHPGAAKVVLATLAGIAAGLVVLGTAALAVAVLGGGGVIAALLIGLAAGLAALATLDGKKLRDIGSRLGSAALSIAKEFGMMILSLPGRVTQYLATASMDLAKAIGSAIADAFRSAWGAFWSSGPHDPTGASPRAINPVKPQSWVPPARGDGGPKVVKTQLIMDGRVLGEAVAQFMSRAGQFQGGSGDFDGLSSPAPVDGMRL